MTPMKPAAGRQHIHYFDPLRLIAAFCVIFNHTASALIRGGIDAQWELLNVCVSFSYTSVPLFLMMSGYLLLSDDKTTDIPYLFTKRLPRLAVPLAFWSVTALLETLLAQHALTPSRLWEGMVLILQTPSATHLWYMYQLIALYLLSPLLRACVRSLDETGHRYILGLIAAITVQSMLLALLPATLEGYVSWDVFGKLKIFYGNLWTFFLGYYLGRTKRRVPNGMLAVCAIVLLAVISAGTHVLTAGAGEYRMDFQDLSVGFEVALAACVFLLWKQNCVKPIPRFLAPAVSLSMPVYLMHGPLLTLLTFYGITPHTFLGTAAGSAAVFAVCFLCMKTAASVKPFCFLITGLRYQEACRSCNWQYTFRGLWGRLSQHQTNAKGDR